MAEKLISKIQLTGESDIYVIKDAWARQAISELGHPFEYHVSTTAADTPKGVTWGSVTGTLEPSASTEYIIYLVQSTGVSGSYVEYITVKVGTTYSWEKIGTTAADLSEYSKKGHTHLVSITSGSTTPTLSISNHTVTQGSVSVSGKYTPAGTNSTSSVTVNRPGTSTASKVKTIGSVTVGTANVPTAIDTTKLDGGSFTQGTFSGGGFTQGSFSGGNFYGSENNEVLTLTFTPATHGADSHTPASHGTDSHKPAKFLSGFYTAGTPNTPTAVTLPTFDSVSNLWSAATATGTAAAQTFTGTEATITLTGTTSGVAVSAHSGSVGAHTHSVSGTTAGSTT